LYNKYICVDSFIVILVSQVKQRDALRRLSQNFTERTEPKLWRTSIRISGPQTDIWALNIQNMKQKCQSLHLSVLHFMF